MSKLENWTPELNQHEGKPALGFELRLIPDWHKRMTAKQAEQELIGFKFKGPGFYQHEEDTLLVFPIERPRNLFWHQRSPESEVFEFYIYSNCNLSDSINLLVNAPTRTE